MCDWMKGRYVISLFMISILLFKLLRHISENRNGFTVLKSWNYFSFAIF